MWVLGIQLMVPGDFSCLAALAFTYQATYPGPEVNIQEMISHLMDNSQQRTVIFKRWVHTTVLEKGKPCRQNKTTHRFVKKIILATQ